MPCARAQPLTDKDVRSGVYKWLKAYLPIIGNLHMTAESIQAETVTGTAAAAAAGIAILMGEGTDISACRVFNSDRARMLRRHHAYAGGGRH